jgi:hypothetical protein
MPAHNAHKQVSRMMVGTAFQPTDTVMADRGPLSGVIVCMYQSLTQSVPLIVVAGGDGNAASDEATALKSQMLG